MHWRTATGDSSSLSPLPACSRRRMASSKAHGRSAWSRPFGPAWRSSAGANAPPRPEGLISLRRSYAPGPIFGGMEPFVFVLAWLAYVAAFWLVMLYLG